VWFEMDRGGVCARACHSLSSKPILPILSLIMTMSALGCVMGAVYGNYWMKNTTSYVDAFTPLLGSNISIVNFASLDATVHLNPSTVWISFSVQLSFDSPSMDTNEVSVDFSDLKLFVPAAQGFDNVSQIITYLMYGSLSLLSAELFLLMLLCSIIISHKSCEGCLTAVKVLSVLVALSSFFVPVVGVSWWSITVPNPADICMVTAEYQTNMTIDGDMGWSSVLPILGGCCMLIVALLMSIYVPPRRQNSLDAALNAGGDYPQQYKPLGHQDN